MCACFIRNISFNIATGLRLLGATTDLNEAGSLTYTNDVIDIYSNSWGPCDYGCVDGPLKLTQMALKIGVETVTIYPLYIIKNFIKCEHKSRDIAAKESI